MIHEETVYNLRGALFGMAGVQTAQLAFQINWGNFVTGCLVAIMAPILGYFTTKAIRHIERKFKPK
jgi:hypothetical protein